MAEGSTLRFTVDIAADEADGKLKALTAAFDAIGVKAKGSFLEAGRAGRRAGQEVGGLLGKLQGFRAEQMQQARQARFLANEIMSIVPAGSAAGSAVQGLTGLLVEGAAGGLGFGLAFEAIKFAMTPVIAALNEEREAAAKAKAENDKVFSKLMTDADAAARAVQDFNARARGLDPEALRATAGARDLEAPIRAAKARLEYAQRLRAVEESADMGSMATDKTVADWDQEIAAADKALADLEAKQRAFLTRAAQIEGASAAEVAQKLEKLDAEADAKRQAARDRRVAAEAKLMADLWQLEVDRAAKEYALEVATNEALRKLDAEQRGGIEAADREAEKFALEVAEKQSQGRKRMAEDWMATGASISTSVGQAFASVVAGTKSAGEAIQGLMGSVISTLIEMVKKMVMADAIAAAAEGAKSQAGIPIVGPILAASAMATMLSMVQGLMGSMPSASQGFDVGNFNPVTQLHKREMVLPANLADRVRSMTDDGGGAITINVSALDAKSFDGFLERNEGVLARRISAINKARRRS